MKRAIAAILIAAGLGCGAPQPKTPSQACRERAVFARIGRDRDARLEAAENAHCDELELVEGRQAREDRQRAEDRQERADARREVLTAVAPSSYTAPVSATAIDLNGLWLGDYGGNRFETVKIEQTGAAISATKVTGDTNVPAGKPTFTATLAGTEGQGAGHAADPGYQNPRWYPGRLRVLSKDECEFAWGGDAGFTVRFRRLK